MTKQIGLPIRVLLTKFLKSRVTILTQRAYTTYTLSHLYTYYTTTRRACQVFTICVFTYTEVNIGIVVSVLLVYWYFYNLYNKRRSADNAESEGLFSEKLGIVLLSYEISYEYELGGLVTNQRQRHRDKEDH